MLPPIGDLTEFQEFVLAYLYARELEENRLWKRELKDRITMGIRDFMKFYLKVKLKFGGNLMYFVAIYY
jgi:hypothetical protein